MSYRGSDFYDIDTNFEKYMERRQWHENANDTLEKPVICELIGKVTGKKVLDLGCGDATFAKELFDLGCEEYIGIEGVTGNHHKILLILLGFLSIIIYFFLRTMI